MKKITIITLLLFCFSFFKVYAQGTVVVSSSNGINHGLRFSSAQSGERITSNPSDDTNNDTKGPKWGMNFFTNDTLRMFIYNNGNVRMRESLIVEKDLEVNHELSVLKGTTKINYLHIDPELKSNGYNHGGIFFGMGSDYNDTNTGIASRQATVGGGKGSVFGLNFWTKGTLAMNIDSNGKVGIGYDIGKLSPTSDEYNKYLLFVKGAIKATNLKILSVNKWPDYVFAKNYKLKSLENLEKFIETNKHLPNFPSAKQIKDDNNSINVSETITALLKTIEEQTLYIIDVNKKVEKLQEQLNSLKN